MIINTPAKIEFYVIERRNAFAKKGHEWALDANIDGIIWTMTAWEHEPSAKEIDIAKEITLRAMDVYHRSLFIAHFSLIKETNK
jgi:hypothetical protein